MFVGVKRNPVTVILLGLVTCGIYFLYWFYTISQEINNTLGEERINSVLMLILSIVCAPLMLYWLYQIDQALMTACGNDGVNYSSNFLIWLILYLLAGVGNIVASYQIQTALNELWDKRTAGGVAL